MKNGLSRFTFYTQKIEVLLNKAREEKNPAIWLFGNDARTPFFMLEGLARIYGDLHNSRLFGKLNVQFKLIEDGFGQVDYYNWLSKAFAPDVQISAGCKEYTIKQLDRKAALLNEMLADKGWLSEDNKMIIEITEKLNQAGWLNPFEEVEAMAGFYKTAITMITDFAAKANYHFENVESEVHELRRKLRWLSIYPQALQGAVQYAADTDIPAYLQKYLTQEIINSPFNKLPSAGNNTSFLLLYKNYFLALSWMIDRLGSLKDEGLLLIGLCEAIKQSTGCRKEETLPKAYAMLGSKQRKMQEILNDADAITRTFFKEKNLQHLIARTTTVFK